MRPARLPRRLLGTAFAVLASGAAAQSSPWYLGGAISQTRDSNVLRIDEGLPVPAGLSKSDSITATTLLAGLDQSIGRQRVTGSVALRDSRFADNPRYDNRGWSLSGGLDWSTVERISGNVSLSSNRSLQRFSTEEIGVLADKNLETANALSLRVAVGVVTRWSMEAQAARRVTSNSLDIPTVQSRNFEQNNFLLGLRWRPSGATNVRVGLGGAEGRYPKYIRLFDGSFRPDRFKRTDLEFTAQTELSGASSIDLRLARGRTSYDLNSQRDFTGLTGNLRWQWRPTGKLSLDTQLSRDTGTDSFRPTFNVPTNTDYSRLLTSLRVDAGWALSAKLNVNAGLALTRRDLVNSVGGVIVGARDLRGSDDTQALSVGVRWAPLRGALLGCDASSQSRDSDGVLSRDLKASSFGCYGQWVLQ